MKNLVLLYFKGDFLTSNQAQHIYINKEINKTTNTL